MINQQKGYALLITLLLVILIGVLGLAMLTANVTSSKQNKLRETAVLAEDLAVKGAEYFTLSLQSELETSINNSRLTVPQYIDRLKSVLQKNSYQCSTSEVEIKTESSGTTSVCIERIYLEDIPSPTAQQLSSSLKWIVVLRSTSTVEQQTRIVRQHLMYGTDNVPDQLRYALSSNEGGNLYLHGGIDIYGDIKTEGNLILSDTAFWKSGNEVQWVRSLAPRVISRSFTPKVILPTDTKYNIYTMQATSEMSTTNFDNGHITGKYFGTLTNFTDRQFYAKHYTKHIIDNSTDVNNIKNYLTDGANISFERRNLPPDNLNITNEIQLQKNSNLDLNYESTTITSSNFRQFNTNKNKTFYFGKELFCVRSCNSWYPVYSYRDGSSDLTLRGSGSTYIGVKGIYYINGDLNISGINLQSDAIFYVNGSVTMRDSSVVNGSNLFIFSNGEIEISNMSVDRDTPSNIKGFFYTKANFLMYGVGSNINLNGGISAKRIILTGIRGYNRYNSYPSVSSQSSYINGQRIPSRLTIDYDPNLIPEFITFTRPADTEITPTMNPPLILEQQISNKP